MGLPLHRRSGLLQTAMLAAFAAAVFVYLAVGAALAVDALSNSSHLAQAQDTVTSEELPPPTTGSGDDSTSPGELDNAIPEGEQPASPSTATEVEEGEQTTVSDEPADGGAADAKVVPRPNQPDVVTDLEELPFPTRKMRELILSAARTGDVERLRPYIGYGDDVTMLSLGGQEDDPIDFLRSLSGDPEGHEILAIITEILEAPAVKFESMPGQYIYVWPYYYAYPMDELTPEQRVDLFRIITYGDYEEMVAFGNYIFYRLGITPEGRWRFFVAGD